MIASETSPSEAKWDMVVAMLHVNPVVVTPVDQCQLIVVLLLPAPLLFLSPRRVHTILNQCFSGNQCDVHCTAPPVAVNQMENRWGHFLPRTLFSSKWTNCLFVRLLHWPLSRPGGGHWFYERYVTTMSEKSDTNSTASISRKSHTFTCK